MLRNGKNRENKFSIILVLLHNFRTRTISLIKHLKMYINTYKYWASDDKSSSNISNKN